jgi:hypothetical protein
MMARTRTALITRVLDLLGVTEVGNDPSAEDTSVVDLNVDTVFAQLARRRVFYVQDPNVIEDEFFDPLAVIVANNAGPSFGQSYDPATDALQENKLLQMQPDADATEPVHACYF